ncbi:MAG: energy-coupling factor transporter ATPase [Eubacteriales bacterium]|jgi:energy-coupling factor transport system ATP-binding protein
MSVSDIILQAKDLSYRYESAPEGDLALDGLNITVRKGEFLAILGHNGSGKSTLAKHFNAILLPAGGTMYVAGMDTADESLLYSIRQTVGMVFQNPDNQIVANIVEEDIAFAPENLGVEPAEIRKRVDSALKAVGMYEFREHAPHMLSGGQKQRIAIAGVIAMMPQCIVLDEPTAMLDPAGRSEVLRTIRMLNREYGITIVLITHHMEEAAICDRIVVMKNGHIEADGTPKQVFAQVELLKSIGLAVPQTVELIYLLRKEGMDIPLNALSVEECAEAILNRLNIVGRDRDVSNN